METEYIAVASCACQCIWIKRIMESFCFSDDHVLVLCDNNSTIQLSKNLVFHGRAKHRDVHFHFLRDLIKDGSIELKYCNSQSQIADIMIKPLKLDQFLNLKSMLGLIEASEVTRCQEFSLREGLLIDIFVNIFVAFIYLFYLVMVRNVYRVFGKNN